MATLHELVWAARRDADAWTHVKLARLLGCSLRTVQRHPETAGLSSDQHYQILIRAVHPQNPALAAQLAAARNTTLEALGLKAPVPPPTAPRPEHADSVVYAAADVLQLPPSAVRPAVAAAFARAVEHNVTLEGLARQLAPAKPKTR